MKTIKINDDYSIARDTNCWHVTETKPGTSKDGDPILTKRTLYHGTLEQACRSIIDRSAGRCESLEQILDMLDDSVAFLTSHAESLFREGTGPEQDLSF